MWFSNLLVLRPVIVAQEIRDLRRKSPGMDDNTTLSDLIKRVREGDSEATDELFAHYAQRLSRLAEQHLSRKVSGRVEGEDVVLSVFRTLFRRSAEGKFQIDSRAQLWRLLVKITVHKARMQGRRHTAAMRHVGAEQHDDNGEWIEALVDHEPGPEEIVILNDQIEDLLRGLPAQYRQVLQQRLQGHSATEIASQLAISRQTEYRVLELLKKKLAKSL